MKTMQFKPLRASRAASKQAVNVRAAAATTDKLAALKESGLYGAPFNPEEPVDFLAFTQNADQMSIRRYREAELQHGRLCMLASLGFIVGEQVEGSSFLFDAQVTGPAINHFDQVPLPFWFALGATIFLAEATRIQKGWAEPWSNDLWDLKEGYAPGDLDFDPLGLKPEDPAEFLELQNKEINNGRLAMVGISGMIAQECVNGLQLFAADEAYEIAGKEGLKAMEAACAGKPDEAACAKAFEAALEVADKAKVAAFLASEGIAP